MATHTVLSTFLLLSLDKQKYACPNSCTIGNFNWNGDASDHPVGFTSWAVDQPELETTVINACIELRSALNFE